MSEAASAPVCPACKHELSGRWAQFVGARKEPEPGALCLCSECLVTLVFREGGRLEEMSAADAQRFSLGDLIHLAQTRMALAAIKRAMDHGIDMTSPCGKRDCGCVVRMLREAGCAPVHEVRVDVAQAGVWVIEHDYPEAVDPKPEILGALAKVLNGRVPSYVRIERVLAN